MKIIESLTYEEALEITLDAHIQKYEDDYGNIEYGMPRAEDVPDKIEGMMGGSWSVGDFIAIFARLTQEQQKRIDALEQRITELEGGVL
ncbi:hypothetical protein [Halobacillus naozhouensis]|uniref:Phage protein n=1 Tax=Halobacillus naozhouensis TaxID=554880 RepID=A0ABY8J5T4_9BACI|nr:hypothetical protein [Halobacillus naozhouensis]WFT76251.1 hypothetical protein P9989_07775 [Halobacillus naozhouensis]